MENELRFKASLLVLQQVVAYLLAKDTVESGFDIDYLHQRFLSPIQKRTHLPGVKYDIAEFNKMLAAMEMETDSIFSLAKLDIELIEKKGTPGD